MSPHPLILIPPSEHKTPGGRGAAWSPGTGRFSELDEPRTRVIAALRRAMRGNAEVRHKLLGVRREALASACAANRLVHESPTMPALERYAGVLYGALDASTLPVRSLRRAGEQLVIVSGLWGIVGAADPIPQYKLKMGASLAPLGVLSTWWRPHVSAALDAATTRRVVWDLLPNEHAAAWSPAADLLAGRIRVRFLDRSSVRGVERLTAVSHWNKLLKGALVRHLLATQLDDPAGLDQFEHPLGYRYAHDLDVLDEGRITVSMVRDV